MQKNFNITTSSIYPLGVHFVSEGLHISLVCREQEECGIVLFDRRHKDGIRIPFPHDFRKGNIYSMLIKGYQDRSCTYLFYRGEELFQDSHAMALENSRKYGEISEQLLHCRVLDNSYDWENDKSPIIPFEDSIFYMLHVRGFTKHKTSGVRCKGTYAGIIEKIPYFQELGITALMLMPAYEFDEVFHEDNQCMNMEEAVKAYKKQPPGLDEAEKAARRINYWGYQEGLYFMPKYAYSHSKDAVTEFKDMVKALHKNNIEVIMQFYFPPAFTYIKILEILKYWVIEYHIDGFQLMGVDIPIQALCMEPLFAETKLIGEKDSSLLPVSAGSSIDNNNEYCNFGYMNDAFLYDTRKLLKGDANMIEPFIYLCKNNEPNKGIINYIAKQDGFRLADLVSYNNKHNEANGEENQDGISYNYSWNCGIEGKSRRKSILNLRMRQMKNALTLVLMSQGTPLIYGGDEFGNSQDGNNNPYCQDNSVCWIKWNMLKTNEELFNYTKELISLRKKHKILHSKEPLKGVDYISCGYPDISFHGKDAWRPDAGQESRGLGILYCCAYGNLPDENDDEYIYIGINMYWEACSFGLPKMPKGYEWVRLFSTFSEPAQTPSSKKQLMNDKNDMPSYNSGNTSNISEASDIQNILIPARSIEIYRTQKCRDKNVIPNKHKKNNKILR